MIDFLRSKIDFQASRSPYETSNPDVITPLISCKQHPERNLK